MSQFWQKRATLNICCNVKRANIETAALFTRELRQTTIRMTSCSKNVQCLGDETAFCNNCQYYFTK